MLPRAFATVSDAGYFPGLWALLNSIHAYHGLEIPAFVFDAGLTSRQRLALASASPLRERLTVLPSQAPGAWETKQKSLAALLPLVRTVFLLDADLVLTSAMDDVFAKAGEGWIVSSRDGDESGDLVFDGEYARYSPGLVGRRMPNFNSGALCLDTQRHWDVCFLWGAASESGTYSALGGEPLRLPGHGDQGVLVALVALLGKEKDLHLLEMSEWCDTWGTHPYRISSRQEGRLEVLNAKTGRVQRLVHSSGPKWWTPEGARDLERFGDKLECFRHFAAAAESPVLPA